MSFRNRKDTQALLSDSSDQNYDTIHQSRQPEEGVNEVSIKSDSDSDQLEEDLEDLPKEVRETVPLTDDPTIPVLTFRYFVLSTIFIIPGAFIDTINSFRTTSAVYSIFFVQIASHWAGKWMARVLPDKTVKIGPLSFSLNPGPWSIKETALVTITAKSGATGNLATNALALSELFFHVKVPAYAAMPFMWAIVFIGYSYAAIAKRVVSYDPRFPWPQTLMQTALLQSQDKADKKNNSRRMKVFFWCAGTLCLWQMLPEYLFPMTSSLAVLCWAAPTDPILNFIGSGMGGMGFLNFTLDWANITSEVMLYPYWVQVVQFIAFICGAWILLPLAKWSSLFSFKYGLMSNRLFTSDGDLYPTEKLITPGGGFNSTAYEYYGPVNLGAQRAWNMFFDYAAYVSGVVWVVVFGWSKIRSSFGQGGVYKDRLNKLHSAYADVPLSWYGVLFGISILSLLHVARAGYIFMPFWTCVIALFIGSIIVTPLMWLYALSNFQLPIGTFNELLYGYLVQDSSHKHPAGAAFFGCVAGNAWYRSQFHLESMKLGFYNHIPPKYVFLSQIYGELIGVPINYLSLRWVLASKWDYLVGKLNDPLHQWTAQTVITYHTNAIQYVILGPRRLFANYPALPYGFLVGLIVPAVIFTLHKRFPNSIFKFHLWNSTVFFSTMSHFYGNLSTGYLSKFLGGTVTMFYAYRYKHKVWKKYNYVVAAALDTGFNLSVSIIFILLSLGISAPTWYGNNPNSVERCFALDS
ncbi:hypothetical protein FT663_01438 [Candidozyma haemuli var. vulneris]|nr:hypothetical protein FT662_01633 [[Candida] haemuloni var. vulneris]KAF3994419.1 hypothetical protein FT663_01438 [[Candida] haemuloni var. vulneris]